MTEIDIEQRQRQGIKRTLVVIVCFITAVFGLFVNRLSMDRILSPKELVANGAIMFSSPREIGDFNLLDQNQAAFTKQQLQGQWSFVFFGFTHCPDICPTTLVMMNELNEFLLDTPYAVDTQFLMVSLDPARDTPIKLKPYIEYFNSDFIGLTGEFLSIHRFAKQLNVAFQKIVTNAETGDYTVDHSGHIAVINPAGHFSGFYKPPLDVSRMLMTYKSIRASAR